MALFDKFVNSYTINVECSNCKRIYVARIPKGVTLDAFFGNAVCKFCGCKTIKQTKDGVYGGYS